MWIIAITWKIDDADVYDLLDNNLYTSREVAMENLRDIALHIVTREASIVETKIIVNDENSFHIDYTSDINGEIYEGSSSIFCIREYNIVY